MSESGEGSESGDASESGEASQSGDASESGADGAGSASSGLLAPISGLLSVVFAVMAGASLSYALSGPPSALVVPAVLAAASVGCMVLKRRFEA